ncbi:MAG TPA: response regulator transcription factor [Chloroflexota bacterium]
MAVKVLVADGDPTIRDGLIAILETQPDFAAVGEAGDGHQAVEMARGLRPDVVLMDMGMPNLGGIEATRRIKQESPSTRVIILTTYPSHVTEAFAAGASRYLLKDSPTPELMRAIRGQ